MTIAPEEWYAAQGWKPFDFQIAAWRAFAAGKEGMIVAPTGTGKTYAALFGPLQAIAVSKPSLKILWITPLRALANDLAAAIRRPLDELNTGWTVDVRTGDTSSSRKASQKEKLPDILITTPESLSLLLTYEKTLPQFNGLLSVVVDEWHEILGNKRGVLLELALSRLRSFAPQARYWGMSATIGNLEEACRVLTFTNDQGKKSELIRSTFKKDFEISSLIPKNMQRFPWAGHLGLKLLPEVLKAVDEAKTTLLFTNVRSQAEAWFSAVRDARPDFPAVLHHGSLDRAVRESAEAKIKSGEARLAICTSSLDLGVDFPPVDLVIQIGSPKGVARMLQRLGRSGHTPGQTSRMLCVPTNSFELIEYSAARRACERRDVEDRVPLRLSLDVLVQHIISSALTGFAEADLLEQVRSTHAFQSLSDAQWKWALEFAETGGKSLRAYGQFQRVKEADGIFQIQSPQAARFHRMAIGTIVSDSMVSVRYPRGGSLGSVEESFIARLKPGDRFSFAGKLLQLIQFRDMKAYVRKATPGEAVIPRWMGGRLPLSTHLAEAVLEELGRGPETPELRAAAQILELQARWSKMPSSELLVVETVKIRNGFHLCFYPFEGFKVHEGLASLVAFRLTRKIPLTVTSVVNDYGIELLSSKTFEVTEALMRDLLSPASLLEDILLSLNAAELGKRQFREIARVAGLIFQGYPGAMKTTKQLQVSSGLLYEVFSKYDPENMLLEQAAREVLEQQLEFTRLRASLERLGKMKLEVVALERLSPFSFPLWASFTQSQLSSESWKERIERMIEELETAANDPKPSRRNRK